MPKKLILFPFGGNAREALIAIKDINKKKKVWDVLGFADDNKATHGKSSMGVKVLGGRAILQKFPKACVLAVPGHPDSYLKREEIISGLNVDEKRWATVIHPSVFVAADAKIGANTLIMPSVMVSAGVTIGKHCVILPNTVISHDSTIGDYCCIGSNVSVSGFVMVEKGCYIGSGSSIRNNITIKQGSLVGIGANVVANVESHVTVIGNPARIMQGSGS